jgi:RnfABCDGE-type electron transport complex C subunit
MDPDKLIDAVRQAGVVGEGGAGFPAHVKYAARVETVIANGCECEPLLFSDQHIMATRARRIVYALQAVRQAMGARRAVVAIKDKYARAAAALAEAMTGDGLELFRLDNFYPAGDEQILVYEITGRTVPPLGLPTEVGVVVANVGTLSSVAEALDGRPVTHKIVTVTGEVARPAVVRVPVGTRVARLVEHCGPVTVADPVIVMGGPMMGRMVDRPEALAAEVITKTCGGVVVLPRGHYLHQAATLSVAEMQRRARTACIQCRYCTDLCPRFLIGQEFETHKVMRTFSGATQAAQGAVQAALCCECGLCELFSCPMHLSPRRINQLFKARMRQEGLAYDGPRAVSAHQAALRAYRKIPTDRLAVKIGIDGYMGLHPGFEGDWNPGEVRIPLSQHIGAAAIAVVRPGQRVKAGDLIGEIPEGCLGARVHASIDGAVTAVDQAVTVKGV